MGKIISIDDSAGTLMNSLAISVTANGKFVAVTGADGFIGSHVVNILLGKGYMVRGTVRDLDKARVDFLKLLPKAAENLYLFKGELLEEGCFDVVFQGCDCVFHLACPTFTHQREMKSPEDEMIDQGVRGTQNVLRSCKKAGVKAVVITSSMCAASPKSDRPKIINESHWADHEMQMKKGAYHAASKTLAERAAVEFVAKMFTEQAFRLVRICPAFTVGPMLQPTVNSSMERFAAMCGGGHHERMRNDSISMIDVRDTAAHHVAAYEKGVEGRFFSTTEAWPWTLIYKALEYYCPQMKLPMPLPRGTELLPVREYSKTRMNVLGVKERSFMKVLGDGVRELKAKQLINPSYLDVAGFYVINAELPGRFIMVDVKCTIESGRFVNTAQLSYVIGTQTEPTVLQLPQQGLQLPSTASMANFVLRLGPATNPIVDLNFARSTTEQQRVTLWGTINGSQIFAGSYVTAIPYYVFAGTYVTGDGSDSVTLVAGQGTHSINFSDGLNQDTFTYDPIKRRFSYNAGDFAHRLYVNLSAANGLVIRFVRFNRYHPKGTGSTRIYYRNTTVTKMPQGPVSGAASLANFAGFYPLNNDGSSFVSIEGVTSVSSDGVTPENSIQIGVCTDGINCRLYSSFTFYSFYNSLQLPDLDSNFEFSSSSPYYTSVNVFQKNGPSLSGANYFSVVPQSAFGYKTLEGSNATLTIFDSNVVDNLTFELDGTTVFDTSLYGYNAVQQAIVYDDFRFNFCYNPKKGVTCGVTKTEGGFSSVLYAYPKKYQLK